MADERRARQMVQYHIEGEHVFPEPECPSCRAGRLDEALRRAAEMVAVCEPMYIAGFPQGDEAVTQVMPDALEGWAETIRALNTVAADGKCGYCGQPIQTFPDGTDYCACTTKRPCRHRHFMRPLGKKCVACDVTAPFITALLGGDDEQH